MTRASDDFLKALAGLRQAAGASLQGAAQQTGAQLIDDLARLAGFDGDYGIAGAGGASFGAALAEVRRLAERELSGNAFYAASNKLDALAGLPVSPAPAGIENVAQEAAAFPEPHAEAGPENIPQEAPPAPAPDASIEGLPQGASFDEIAAAAKVRVDEVATSLGIEIAHQHHDAPHLHHHVEETPVAAAELEKRSSEPCAMPEVLPIEPLAQAPAAPIEAASVREVVEAAHEIGTPALAAEPLPEPFAAPEVPPQPAPAPEPAPAAAIDIPPAPEPAPAAAIDVKPARHPEPAPAPEPAPKPQPSPAAAAPKPEAAAPAPAARREAAPKKEPKPKDNQQKTFFSMWLDMVFGRRK